MLLYWIYALGGLALLFVGGEIVVRTAVIVARAMGVSTLFIALVLIAIGTSAPELFVTVEAVLLEAPAIAVGNVIGSNIANVLLILGFASLLGPLVVRRMVVFRDLLITIVVTGLFMLMVMQGYMTRGVGLLFLAGLVLYVAYSYLAERNVPASTIDVPDRVGSFRGILNGILLVLGLAALIGGSILMVDGATGVARHYGVPESAIALTMVAVGTSLPELAATLAAAARREADIVIGTILGSNIFNLFGAMGLAATVRPFEIAPEFLARDVWVMLGATVILVPVLVIGGRLTRIEGLLFLGLYAAYYGLVFSF